MRKATEEFHIYVSPDLRKRVKIAAAESGRTQNAELVALIESGLDKKNKNLVEAVKLLRAAADLIDKGGG